MRAHALGKLERLREGLRLLSGRGLAAIGQQVPATVCGSVESGRADVEPACNNPPLGVGVGEVRHPVRTHTFRERESVGAVAAGDGEAGLRRAALTRATAWTGGAVRNRATASGRR